MIYQPIPDPGHGVMRVSMRLLPKVRQSTLAAESEVGEGFAPAGERLVRGDRDRVLLLAFGEDLEEEFGAAAVEFHVTQFVDAEDVDATVAGDRLVRAIASAACSVIVRRRGLMVSAFGMSALVRGYRSPGEPSFCRQADRVGLVGATAGVRISMARVSSRLAARRWPSCCWQQARLYMVMARSGC